MGRAGGRFTPRGEQTVRVVKIEFPVKGGEGVNAGAQVVGDGAQGIKAFKKGMQGRPGPVDGLVLDHFQMQDIITIAPDRQTAKGRFRGMLLGGWHDSVIDQKPDFMPQQFWEAGIYENDYVREDGVWKIKRLDYMMQWQGDYETGLAHTVAHLQPAAVLYPEDPTGPDVILPAAQIRQTWPHRQDVPMHFAHPRFGAVIAGQGSR
eukprot:gene4206-5739_t